MLTNNAYTAATAAASVGVKMPPRRPPMMMTGRNSAQAESRIALARMGQGSLTEDCMVVELLDTRNQVRTSTKPISNPGTMPAMNNFVIETLAATPKIMKEMEGGIIGATMPPAAINPVALLMS